MIEDDGRRSDPFLDSSDQDSENVEEERERESDFGSAIGLGKRTSPPELRRLLGLAWPQTLSIFCTNATTFTDTAVLGRYGTDELAASSYAGIWIMLTYCLFNGFTSATATLSSQSLGAKNYRLTGIWLQTGIVCGLLMAPPVALSWWFVGDLLRATGYVEDHLCHLASQFSRTMVLKIVPDIVLSVIIEWLIAQEIVRPIAWINLVFLGLNFGLNILFVYGIHGVWSGLGFIGSPLATSVTTILKLVCTVVWMRCREWPTLRVGFAPSQALQYERVAKFLAQALPSGLSMLVENLQFMLVTVWAGHFGETSLAAHSAMLDIFTVLTAGMYGLGDACTVRVGSELGSGNAVGARKVAKLTFFCMIATGVVVGVVFFAVADSIGSVFSNDSGVQRIAKDLSCLVGGLYLMLCLLYASFSVLRGQGRPGIAAISMLVGAWGIAIPLGWVLGFGELGLTSMGVLGLWWGMAGGYGTCALIMSFMVVRSDWSKLSIEAQKRSEKTVDSGVLKGSDEWAQEPSNWNSFADSHLRQSGMSEKLLGSAGLLGNASPRDDADDGAPYREV